MTGSLRLLGASAVVAALFAIALSVPVARADSFTVDTVADGVDANPGDAACATAGGACTLRAAIQEANAFTGTASDSITLPAGNYELSVADGDGSVDLDITSPITINGGGAPGTFVDPLDADRAFDVAATGLVGISNLTVRNGSASSDGGDGGGIRNQDGQLQLSNVALDVNAAPAATVGGGGLFNDHGSVTIADSTISTNTAAGASAGGGGIANFAGTVTMTNVTISGNSSAKGGAIYNAHDGAATGDVSTNNVTIAANTSAGGNLFNDSGSVSFRNTIVGPNTGPNCVTDLTGTFVSAGYNLSNDDDCPFFALGDLQLLDPDLGPLADNGGPTKTHAISLQSNAVNAGDDAGCADTDQRGFDRPQGAHCDIGAFELDLPDVQGDVDCTGEVNAVDALKVLRHSASLPVSQTEPCPNQGEDVAGHPFGDVDCDGSVNSVDALKVLRHNASLAVMQNDPCTLIGEELQ